MSILDLNSLLQDVSPDSPTGEDFEYKDPFTAIARNAEGTPDQILGNSTLPGTPPDWKSVRDDSVKLFSQTKDLRIAISLARALLHTNGIEGFSEGVTLIRRMLESWWDTLHPKLDPEDDNDPTLRINTIMTLCDRKATLLAVSRTPLVKAKSLGQFGLNDILVASGEIPPPPSEDKPTPDMASISAAFLDCPIEDLKNTAEILVSAKQHIDAIDAFLMNQVGSSRAADFSALTSILDKAAAIVNKNLENRGETLDPGAKIPASGTPEAPRQTPPAISGEIRSREDAARMMDKITEYFRKAEPSSPVPLLMQRAKRLSNLGFMEILKDIAPNGLEQAKNIGGIGGGEEN